MAKFLCALGGNVISVFLMLIILSPQFTVGIGFASESVTSNALQEVDWWPMFCHDLSRTGVSSADAPNSNETLWIYDTRHQIMSSPAVFEGVLFIGNNEDARALNATTGRLIWNYKTMGGIYSAPSVANGRVFVSQSGDIYALNASTGEFVWSFEFWGSGFSSPAVTSGKVFIGSGFDHKVYALDEKTGKEIWNSTIGGNILSSPAVANDVVYVGSSDYRIYALNASTGSVIWSYMTGDHVYSSPCIADGKVFVGSNDGHLYALNSATGTLEWSFSTAPHGSSSTVSSSPAVWNGIVYVGSMGAGWPWNFFALNSSNGALLWNHTGGFDFSSPAIADHKVFVLNYDGRFDVLDALTGQMVWTYDTGCSASTSSPAVANGRVYFGTGTKIYCFGPMLFFNITVAPEFYDNWGQPLVPSPSQWTIKFPNGTRKSMSSVETYRGPMGTYFIDRVVWKGMSLGYGFPQGSRISHPSIFLESDSTWMPRINCTLPTSLSLSLSSSTSFIGFKVNITGNLTCNELGVQDAPVLLSSSVTGGESWSDITLVNTDTYGQFSAIWMPQATGHYNVKADWAGNSTFPSATVTVNLAVTPYDNQVIFSVESNSTISALAYNATSRKLNFIAAGENDTIGYSKVTIAKTLVSDASRLEISIDGIENDYAIIEAQSSWILVFTYDHSMHYVTINLGSAITTGIQLTHVLLGIIIAGIIMGLILGIFIKMRRQNPENNL